MSNPYQPSPFGHEAVYSQPYAPAPQEHPQGTAVLVLGILGFFVGLTAPIAWYLGNKTLAEMRASGRAFSNEQNVVIGRILGIIGTVLLALYVLLLVVYVIFMIVLFGSIFASSR